MANIGINKVLDMIDLLSIEAKFEVLAKLSAQLKKEKEKVRLQKCFSQLRCYHSIITSEFIPESVI